MKKVFALLALLPVLVVPAWGKPITAVAENPVPILAEKSIIQPLYGQRGMVVSADKFTSQVGLDVLEKGGNAIDAAISMAFSMAVTLPRAGNLGGGGFMMIYDAEKKKTKVIDYREMAPAAASADMFLDESGNVDKNLARFSYKSAGVPGTVKGMDMAHRLYATMEWNDLLQPAVHLAKKGFKVSKTLSESLKAKHEHLSKSPNSKAVFYPKNGFYEEGDTLKQVDLAQTLKTIAKEGADAFYQGAIAQKIADDMAAYGGLITKEDLSEYVALLQEPVSGYYKGYRVVSMPPPSSGGVHLIQMLKVLSYFPLEKWGFGSARTMHVMAEVMRLAYADRSKYLGDPAFVDVPVRELTSDLYANRLSKSISLGSATPSQLIEPGKFLPDESPQTTHFTVVDSWGNVVTNTYTLNFSYGSGHMVKGTGILLNNEMDDFSAKVGVANAYGLVGGNANAIEPRKRPLSSMTPTLVFDKNGEFLLALGSPGGSRIITSVLQVILNVLDHEMNLAEAVVAPRMHHQWQPDEIFIERGFSPDTLELLRMKGQNLKPVNPMGAVMAVMKTANGYAAFADTRRPDASALSQAMLSRHDSTLNSVLLSRLRDTGVITDDDMQKDMEKEIAKFVKILSEDASLTNIVVSDE